MSLHPPIGLVERRFRLAKEMGEAGVEEHGREEAMPFSCEDETVYFRARLQQGTACHQLGGEYKDVDDQENGGELGQVETPSPGSAAASHDKAHPRCLSVIVVNG